MQAGDLIGTSSGGSASVYFKPDADFNGTTQFGVAARDDQGAEDASPAYATIEVYAVNDRPTVDLDSAAGGNDYATTVTGNGQEVGIAAMPSIADVDDPWIQGAIVTLTNGEAGEYVKCRYIAGGNLVAGFRYGR